MMKKIIIISLALFIIIACRKKEITSEVELSNYTPVLMNTNTMRNSIKFIIDKKLENPGKIYYFNKHIYVVDKYEGIHIYDNTDASNPVHKGFVNIPGCINLAVKNNILYADNAVDLVAIDIGGYTKATEVQRFKDIFPELLPPDLNYLPTIYSKEKRPENTTIIKWEERKK